MEERQVGTMHVKDGWNFQRVDDGAVRIYINDPTASSGSDNRPLAQITIPGNEWESVIAAMSAHKDSARGFSMAQAFHQADPILNFGMINAVAEKVDNVTDG